MKLLLRYAKPFAIPMICVLVLVASQSIGEIILPKLLADMIDSGIAFDDMSVIWRDTALMAAAALGTMAVTILGNFMSSRVATSIAANIRRDIFFRVETFATQEIDKFGTASLITRSTNDVSQVQMLLSMFMRMGLFSPLMLISGLMMAVSTSRQLSLILVVAVPILVIFISITLIKATKYFKTIQKKVDNINMVMRENLTGMRVIRAFRKTPHEIERFDGANEDYTKISIITNRIMGMLMPAVSLIMNLTTIAVMFFGGQMVMKSAIDVGSLVAYIQYITHILMSITIVSTFFMMYPRAAASAARIAEVIDTRSDIQDGGFAGETGKRGTVEFRNVDFIYPGADEEVLQSVSFKAEPGKTTAIIGSTGSGKSTIANLLPRFYDATKGEILVDGVDVRKYDLKVLRDKIGYVPQKAVLFSGTIADNLRFGKMDATEEEMLKAAQTAQAMEFISSKEKGFNSYIAQGGANVSGGQKQRLAIARAIVKQPEIYIFDDSFSALDYKTDAALRKALKGETKDAAVIIIAQRISTIMHADSIVVLDDGRVAGTGTHEELMESCSVYREIVDSQFKKGELDS